YRSVSGNVHEIIGRQWDVHIGIAVDHEVVDGNRDLLAETVRAGAEDVELFAVRGSEPTGLRDCLDQRGVAGGADAPGTDDRANDGDGLAGELDYLHRNRGFRKIRFFEQRLETGFDLRGRKTGH